MSTDLPNARSVLEQNTREQSFRRRIVDLIGGVLRSDAPFYFKSFVVILLFLCLTASLVISIFILDVLLAIFKGTPIEPVTYAAILGCHGLIGVAIGFPLTMRMSSLEQTRQLEANLRKVQRARGRRRKANATAQHGS